MASLLENRTWNSFLSNPLSKKYFSNKILVFGTQGAGLSKIVFPATIEGIIDLKGTKTG
jgi:hypothetical protein